jgi:hypothetical protein
MRLIVLFSVCILPCLLWTQGVQSVRRSSHSEAPGTAKLPVADNTDFYFFRSYETGREGYVTFVMNVQGGQNPFSGPNYFALGDDYYYSINIDNDGDLNEDLSFRFYTGNRLGGESYQQPFQADYMDCELPSPTPPPDETKHYGLTINVLDTNGNKINILDTDGTTFVDQGQYVPLKTNGYGEVTTPDDADLNWFEWYQIDLVNWNVNNGDSPNQAVDASNNEKKMFEKPFDYAGTKTLPDYEKYVTDYFYHDIKIQFPGSNSACGTGRVFVGQRVDPFFVNLGEIFDSVSFDPIYYPPDPHLFDVISEETCHNDLRYINVDSFVLEVPTACIQSQESDVIGAWAAVYQLCHQGSGHVQGQQLSRMGNPLMNELIIGIGEKGNWNQISPSEDGKQFDSYVKYPSYPAILDKLFRSTVNMALGATLKNIAPSYFPRTDLYYLFQNGFPGLNQPPNIPTVGGEMMRLNVTVPPVARENQKPMGFIDGDAAGYPNGRRPGDDAIDISLRVVMGRLCYLLQPAVCADITTAQTKAPVGLVDFTDGAPISAMDFDDQFPYLRLPLPGSHRPYRCGASRVYAGVSFMLLLIGAILSAF